MMRTKTDFLTTPRLGVSALVDEARDLVAASNRLGASPWASTMRARTVSFCFEGMEEAFDSGAEPVAAVRRVLHEAASLLDRAPRPGPTSSRPDAGGRVADGPDEVRRRTGEYYGALFAPFSSEAYFGETARLLRERLDRNGALPADLEERSVLDAGCGGGRYTVAWRRLGARRSVGVDASVEGIADARRRAREAGIDGVEFETGDVLALPVPDDSFGVVFSNGVLHHTTDWRRGVREVVRALEPGGLGWLYLIEHPGGIFWDVVEVLRLVMRDESPAAARAALDECDVPANRVFYLLDHVMAPINLRLTPAEVESCLAESGAAGIRRLARGADRDRIERIHCGEPFAAVKYGVGENRYVFTKQ